MNKGNMLCIADEFDECVRLSQKDTLYNFDMIWEYPDGEAPSAEEIAIVERVLKYASHCKYVGFTDADARLVMSLSTSVLNLALHHGCKDGHE